MCKLIHFFNENNSLFKLFKELLIDPKTDPKLKAKIKKYSLASIEDEPELKLEQEKFKYSLWLDSERTSLFFAKHVLICEGASEKIFFDFLLTNKWIDFNDDHIYILDSLGKFNIHRFMNLFKYLGINHSILMDCDENETQTIVNGFIENHKNDYTNKISLFDNDLESFLEIEQPKRKDLKPLNIMFHYSKGLIPDDKVEKLKLIFADLVR
jgi:putative ATP-dependent endonuclease of the OLD family